MALLTRSRRDVDLNTRLRRTGLLTNMENPRNIVFTTTTTAAAPASITITTTYHKTAMFCPHTVSNLFIHSLFIYFALIIYFLFSVFSRV